MFGAPRDFPEAAPLGPRAGLVYLASVVGMLLLIGVAAAAAVLTGVKMLAVIAGDAARSVPSVRPTRGR